MAKFYKYIFFVIFNTIFVLSFVSGDYAEMPENREDLAFEPLQGENAPPDMELSEFTTNTPLFSPKYDLRNYTVNHLAPFGYHREFNIILYGITPANIKKHGSLFAYVFYLLTAICEVELHPQDIMAIRYLRKKDTVMHHLGQIWPVLVTLRTLDLKAKLIHRRRLLSLARVKMEHELPPEVYDAQNKILKPIMKKHRDLGAYAVIRNGKLIVNGMIVTQIPVPRQFTYDSRSEERYNALVHKKLQEQRRLVVSARDGFSPKNGNITFSYQDQPEANMEETP